MTSRALAQISGRRHGSTGRQYIVNEHDAAVASLHLQNAGAVFQIVGHIDHRRRQLALLAHQHKSLAPANRQCGTQDKAARLYSRQRIDFIPFFIREQRIQGLDGAIKVITQQGRNIPGRGKSGTSLIACFKSGISAHWLSSHRQFSV